MRTKEDILNSTYHNAKKSHESDDICLIHELHTLEVLIDIRDTLKELSQVIAADFLDHAKKR